MAVGDSVERFVPPPATSGLNRVNLMVTTPVYRSFNGSFEVRRGEAALFAEASPGLERRYVISATARPAPSIRLAATLTLARLLREQDRSDFGRTTIPRLVAEYQATRTIFFRLVGEYRSERYTLLRDGDLRPLLYQGLPYAPADRRGLRMDALFSYQPTPGTVAFFGYGSSFDPDPARAAGPLLRSTDGFFAKLSYVFRQ